MQPTTLLTVTTMLASNSSHIQEREDLKIQPSTTRTPTKDNIGKDAMIIIKLGNLHKLAVLIKLEVKVITRDSFSNTTAITILSTNKQTIKEITNKATNMPSMDIKITTNSISRTTVHQFSIINSTNNNTEYPPTKVNK